MYNCLDKSHSENLHQSFQKHIVYILMYLSKPPKKDLMEKLKVGMIHPWYSVCNCKIFRI
jgi:hypothetical protein